MKKSWTIHRFWPEYTHKNKELIFISWPQFCQPNRYKEYDETLLLKTYPNITTVWPPESLWKHE